MAVKVIDKKKAREDAYVRKNLRREGRLLQQVRNRYVVQLYEIMETENSYYLVMELCEGGDLMDLICQKKKLDERETRRFVRQVVCAVEYLHKAGILHRLVWFSCDRHHSRSKWFRPCRTQGSKPTSPDQTIVV